MWRAYIQENSNTQCIWPDSEPTKLLYHPKQSLVEEGASGTCRQVTLLVNFYEKTTFRVCCLSCLVHDSQKWNSRNWERGRAVSFPGIFVSNFWYSVFTVLQRMACNVLCHTITFFSNFAPPQLLKKCNGGHYEEKNVRLAFANN